MQFLPKRRITVTYLGVILMQLFNYAICQTPSREGHQQPPRGPSMNSAIIMITTVNKCKGLLVTLSGDAYSDSVAH